MDDVNYEFGVDFNSSWDFSDNDLKFVSYDDNIKQAIVNRLNSPLDELDLFYEDYGSNLNRFLGLKNKSYHLKLIELEIEKSLENDPRLTNVEVTAKYDGNGALTINLVVGNSTDEDLEFNLILNEDSVEVDE